MSRNGHQEAVSLSHRYMVSAVCVCDDNLHHQAFRAAQARLAGLRGTLRATQARLGHPPRPPSPSPDSGSSSPLSSPASPSKTASPLGSTVRGGASPAGKPATSGGGRSADSEGHSGSSAGSRSQEDHFLAASPDVARRLAGRLEAVGNSPGLRAGPGVAAADPSAAPAAAATTPAGDTAAGAALDAGTAAAAASAASRVSAETASACSSAAAGPATPEIQPPSPLPFSFPQRGGPPTANAPSAREPHEAPTPQAAQNEAASTASGDSAASASCATAVRDERVPFAERILPASAGNAGISAAVSALATASGASDPEAESLLGAAPPAPEEGPAAHPIQGGAEPAGESDTIQGGAEAATEADAAAALLQRRAATAAELVTTLQAADDVAPELACCPLVLSGAWRSNKARVHVCHTRMDMWLTRGRLVKGAFSRGQGMHIVIALGVLCCMPPHGWRASSTLLASILLAHRSIYRLDRRPWIALSAAVLTAAPMASARVVAKPARGRLMHFAITSWACLSSPG